MTTLERYNFYVNQNKAEIEISFDEQFHIEEIIEKEGKYSPFKKEDSIYLLSNGVILKPIPV